MKSYRVASLCESIPWVLIASTNSGKAAAFRHSKILSLVSSVFQVFPEDRTEYDREMQDANNVKCCSRVLLSEMINSNEHFRKRAFDIKQFALA